MLKIVNLSSLSKRKMDTNKAEEHLENLPKVIMEKNEKITTNLVMPDSIRHLSFYGKPL